MIEISLSSSDLPHGFVRRCEIQKSTRSTKNLAFCVWRMSPFCCWTDYLANQDFNVVNMMEGCAAVVWIFEKPGEFSSKHFQKEQQRWARGFVLVMRRESTACGAVCEELNSEEKTCLQQNHLNTLKPAEYLSRVAGAKPAPTRRHLGFGYLLASGRSVNRFRQISVKIQFFYK